MKKLMIVLCFLTFAVIANGSYKLGLNVQPTLSSTGDIFEECIKVSDKEYCVLYALGYLGYYTDENTEDMDRFLDKHKDMFTGSEQAMVVRLSKFYNTMYEDEDIGQEEAEYICTIAGALTALYYAESIEKDLSIDQASSWAVDSCKTGLAPFNISMYAMDKISYLSRF